MEEKVHLLIVDDDSEIRLLLAKLLKEYNYDVSTAKDGVELFEVLEKTKIDLIVLDLMMPGDDGLTLCRKLRSSHTIPIIMLTAAGDDTDRIVGLEVGADDYMAKPFNPRELVARIKAVLRRSQDQQLNSGTEISAAESEKIEFADWVLDLSLRKLLSPEQAEVELSTGEYVLLTAFVNSPQIVLSRDQLLDFTQ